MLKKLALTLLLITPLLSLTACKEYVDVPHSDIVVGKYSKQEYDAGIAYFVDIRLAFSDHYYLVLEKYRDHEVSESEYNRYGIGDTYTWTTREEVTSK